MVVKTQAWAIETMIGKSKITLVCQHILAIIDYRVNLPWKTRSTGPLKWPCFQSLSW